MAWHSKLVAQGVQQILNNIRRILKIINYYYKKSGYRSMLTSKMRILFTQQAFCQCFVTYKIAQVKIVWFLSTTFCKKSAESL